MNIQHYYMNKDLWECWDIWFMINIKFSVQINKEVIMRVGCDINLDVES